jgi:hypothetical protein
MARKVIVELVDDLDGSPIGENSTITFSLEKKAYEIDLSDANLQKLRDALAPFISAARPAGASGSRASSSPRKAPTHDVADVRAWAAEHGHQVSSRGRVPASVLEAYDAAH